MRSRNIPTIFMIAILLLAGLAAPASLADRSRPIETESWTAASVANGPISAVDSRRIRFTSIYTDLRRQCRSDGGADPESGQDPVLQCSGPGGFKIVIDTSAMNQNLRVEPKRMKNHDESIFLAMQGLDYSYSGRKVEWRLINGMPFAVILRIDKTKDGVDPMEQFQKKNLAGQSLLVQGLGQYKYLVKEFDASKPNANADARQWAEDNVEQGE